MNLQKIMIGTAQFGMNYGIANQDGQVQENEITKILNLAEKNKISMIDTASQYGTSETILGKLANPKHFKMISKLRPLPKESLNIDSFVRQECLSSLNHLKRESLDGLLIHHAADLLNPRGKPLYEALHRLKQENKIKKIGISVYCPEQLLNLLDFFTFDIIQLPLNILDQRFLQKDFLSQLKENKIELHVRSIFLQGLLLMENIPSYFDSIKPLLSALREDCMQNNLTLRKACIQFILSVKEIDHSIFGIDNHHQFSEIIADFSNSQTQKLNFNKYRCDDLQIINPINWKIS